MNDLILQYTSLPNLHPALVHLPLALAPVAWLFDLFSVFLRRSRWLDRAGAALWAAAALGAFAALEAGEDAADSMTHLDPRVQPAIAEHSDWAHWALWALAAVAVLRLILAWMERMDSRSGRLAARVVLLVAGLAVVGLLARTGDLGGALVFQHGLGVHVGAEGTPEAHAGAEGTEGEDGTAAAQAEPGSVAVRDDPSRRLEEGEDGVVTWTPAPGDSAALGSVVTAAPGSSLGAVTAALPEDGAEGLGLWVDGRSLLVLPGAFGNVQVEARLRLDGFEGTLGVAHHVRGAKAAGLFAVTTGGKAELLSLDGDSRELLDEASFELPDGAFTLAVSAAGRHLKGLVDERQLTHGHADPPPDGAAGLLLDGHGGVRLLSLRVIPLGED